MPEVSRAGEDHTGATFVCEFDGGIIANAASGLDHRGRSCIQSQLDPIGEGEEGIAGDGAARQRETLTLGRVDRDPDGVYA